MNICLRTVFRSLLALDGLLRVIQDVRKGSISRDVANFPSELCSRRSLIIIQLLLLLIIVVTIVIIILITIANTLLMMIIMTHAEVAGT